MLGVGGAIVADSDGMGEWRECLIKGGFVRDAQAGRRIDLIETMRFDPEKGIALLELHLERMKASAAELGFSFDRHEARNRIQALCFELEEPAKAAPAARPQRRDRARNRAAARTGRWPGAVHRAAAAGRAGRLAAAPQDHRPRLLRSRAGGSARTAARTKRCSCATTGW